MGTVTFYSTVFFFFSHCRSVVVCWFASSTLISMQWCDRMLLNGQSQINHAHHWERQKKNHTMNEVGNCVSVSLWHTRSIKSWRLVWRVFTCCDDDFFSLLYETPLTNGSSRSSTINFSSLIFGIGLPLLLSIDSSFLGGRSNVWSCQLASLFIYLKTFGDSIQQVCRFSYLPSFSIGRWMDHR